MRANSEASFPALKTVAQGGQGGIRCVGKSSRGPQDSQRPQQRQGLLGFKGCWRRPTFPLHQPVYYSGQDDVLSASLNLSTCAGEKPSQGEMGIQNRHTHISEKSLALTCAWNKDQAVRAFPNPLQPYRGGCSQPYTSFTRHCVTADSRFALCEIAGHLPSRR